ncbi:MAG TPA: HAD-IA family hydrolase [Candidatus Limnocylindria bacterium]
MSPIEVLFVDKGGVLIDNTTLSGQWRRLIGEFLAPRLGGRHEEWGAANVPAFERQWMRFQQAAAAGGPADIRGFFAKDARQWFLDMCDGVGIDRPPDDVADALAADTVRYVRSRLEIPVPRTLDALRALRARGIVLHTASADAHDDLVEFLERIGARDLFDRVYGSDLVNTWKFGPAYYRAVLADSGVDPARAAVVDDQPQALAWASECGLRGFLVERQGGQGFDEAVGRTFDEVARAID